MEYTIGKVQLRDGTITEVERISKNENDYYPLLGKYKGYSISWSRDGRFYDNTWEHDRDIVKQLST